MIWKYSIANTSCRPGQTVNITQAVFFNIIRYGSMLIQSYTI